MFYMTKLENLAVRNIFRLFSIYIFFLNIKNIFFLIFDLLSYCSKQLMLSSTTFSL